MKTKYPRATVLPVAERLVELLRPVTERIEICGSLRRGKPEVSDVEILYCPKIIQIADGLFGTQLFDVTNDKLDNLLREGVIAKRPNVRGHFAWGKLNKLGIDVATGIPCDFFCEPDPLDWFRSLVIRTGSAEFNERMLGTAKKNGVGAHAYGMGLEKGGTRIPVHSEQEFIEKCGVKFLLPYQRNM